MCMCKCLRLCHALSIAFLICVHLTQSQCAGADTASAAAQKLTSAILNDLTETRESIYKFWRQHGLDQQYGGFHGTLDLSGAAVPPTFKGLVQQARHTWAFSMYHAHKGSSSPKSAAAAAHSRNYSHVQSDPGKSQKPMRTTAAQQQKQFRQLPSSQNMARSAYTFMVKHMHDPSTDMFHWTVTRDGQLLQDNKVIYGQWFVLYALSQYYTAFRDPQAVSLALKCFKAMDRAWHSAKYAGFDELPSNAIPPAPQAAGQQDKPAASRRQGYPLQGNSTWQPAAQPKQQQQQQVRTLNVAMHGLEALTALHKVTRDAVVLQRVREYLHIICTRLQRSHGLIFEEYLPATGSQPWAPVPGSVVNYGHNLESTWLVADTLEYLDSISAISHSLSQQYRQAVMSIGAAAVRDGFDAQHGGIFESGLPGTGPQSRVKVWWVQAEGMLALWKLHRHQQQQKQHHSHWRNSKLQYLSKLSKTASFVRRHLTDVAGTGEQYWQVQPDGRWQASGSTEKDTKGNQWKASYHNSRSVLFLDKWMRQQ